MGSILVLPVVVPIEGVLEATLPVSDRVGLTCVRTPFGGRGGGGTAAAEQPGGRSDAGAAVGNLGGGLTK